MSSPLNLDVFVVPCKPIVPAAPPMSPGEATWPATANSLISGERDAVLIDTPLAAEDAQRVVDWIQAKEKNLTTIYITHGHGDHFFGLNTILSSFPTAKAVTRASVVPEAREQLSPELMQFWNAILPGQIPEHPIVPEALEEDMINVEGHEIRIVPVGSSDTIASTIAHVPSLDAVVAGDVAYNGIHQWLFNSDHEQRMGWIASVEKIEALNPKIVVAGHQNPGTRNDDLTTILAGTKAYIRDFESSLARSRSAQELVDKMIALHGDRRVPHTLWLAAYSMFPDGQGPS